MSFKDLVFILAFLGIGSNEFRQWVRDDPEITREVIERQTTTIDRRLETIQLTLRDHGMAIRLLSSSIVDNRDRTEEVNDSLRKAVEEMSKTVRQGFSNLDGYFDTRFDSLLNSTK